MVPIRALVMSDLHFGSAFSLRAALREAVGLVVHFQDVDVVGQAVEERAGQVHSVHLRRPKSDSLPMSIERVGLVQCILQAASSESDHIQDKLVINRLGTWNASHRHRS